MEVSLAEARRIAVRAQLLDGSATGRPHDGPPARVPPDRPDLDRRAAAVPRPLEPARPVRPRRARPAALGGEEALRVERVHLADRGPAADPGADARALGPAQVAAAGEGVPEGASGAPEVRAPRARATRPAALAGARAPRRPRRRAHRLVGHPGPADVDAGAPHRRGRIAVAGRQSGQRLWDLAERWYPETETVPLAEARRLLDEKRFRALGVRREKGARRPPGGRGRPRSGRASRSSRPSTASSTTATGPRRCGTSSTGSRCTCRRRSASTATTSSRSCAATGYRPDRAGLRPEGERAPRNGVFAEPGAPASAGPAIARATRSLAKWLGAEEIAYSRRVPSIWRDSLRN